MQSSRFLLTILGLLITGAPTAFSADVDSKVETFDVAPAGQWLACTISPRGVHAAVLVKKENRYAILIDGVEGPAFDEILPFDGRPFTLGRPLDTTIRVPVAFSDDGEHHAFLAKIGEDYVLFRDGRELARGKFGAKLSSLTFSSGANHLYYIESDPALGARLVVDGKPEAPLQESPKVVFSKDGKRYAYVARKKGEPKQTLFVDGQAAPYAGEDPQFTFDSKSLVTVARTAPNNHSVLVEGKPLFRTKYVFKVYVSPFADQIVSVVHTERGANHRLMLFDKDVPDSECSAIGSVHFSPDGKRYAAICSNHGYTRNLKQVNQGSFVFLDGKRGAVYQNIRNSSDTSQDRARQMWISGGHLRPDHPPFVAPGFTPDSSKFVYIPWTGQQEYVVVNDQASEPYASGKVLAVVVGSGQHVAYLFNEPIRRVVFDGQARDLTYRPHSLTFSPDGTRWAYDHASICLDGVDVPINADPAQYLFSPDSKHLVAVGQTTTASPKRGLFIDADLVLTNVEGIERPVFTPDSQHLLWIGRGDGRSEQENKIACVDGRPAVAFRELINTRDNWEMSAKGTLSFVARTGDALKRFRITPAAGSGVSAMIATAKAGGPKSALAEPLPTVAATVAAPALDVTPAAESANPAAAPSPVANNSSVAPAPTAGTPSVPNATALPGTVGDVARKADQTTSELEKTKAELQKAKTQLKSLWDAITPKKK